MWRYLDDVLILCATCGSNAHPSSHCRLSLALKKMCTHCYSFMHFTPYCPFMMVPSDQAIIKARSWAHDMIEDEHLPLAAKIKPRAIPVLFDSSPMVQLNLARVAPKPGGPPPPRQQWGNNAGESLTEGATSKVAAPTASVAPIRTK